jgi:hypothetical protein
MPSLVSTLVARPPVKVSVVSVGPTVDIEASSTKISDVLLASIEPSHLLESFIFIWLGTGNVSFMGPVSCTVLDTNSFLSVRSRSDRLGSPVEDPPLSNIIWVVVLDSESELVSTNVLVPSDGFT